MFFSTYSQTSNGPDSMVSLSEPLKHVKTLRGPFRVSRKLAIRDEPNIGRSSARIRGDIWNVHTGGSACHTTHTHTPQTPHALPHTHTPQTPHHTETDRERQRKKTERDKRKDERQEKGKTRRNFDFFHFLDVLILLIFSIFLFYVFEFLDFFIS